MTDAREAAGDVTEERDMLQTPAATVSRRLEGEVTLERTAGLRFRLESSSGKARGPRQWGLPAAHRCECLETICDAGGLAASGRRRKRDVGRVWGESLGAASAVVLKAEADARIQPIQRDTSTSDRWRDRQSVFGPAAAEGDLCSTTPVENAASYR